jgi:hypothetical protein
MKLNVERIWVVLQRGGQVLSNGNISQELEDYGTMERCKSSTYSETKWANKSILELTTF